MSRSDFWSIAATLLVAGVAYFVGGRMTAYGCFAVGVVIIVYLLLTHKKREPPSVSVTANPQITANPEMTANPKMNQTVHFHLPSSEKKDRPSPSPAMPRPRHNLQLHSCKMIHIEESVGPHGEMNGFHSTHDQTKPNAAVVCIKNKSKESEVAILNDVRGALVFCDGSGKEIGSGIDQAVWVDNHLRNASFDLEETKCVIVAVMHRDYQERIKGISAPYIRTRPVEYGNALTVEKYPLNGDLSTVEVILLAENSRVMEPMIFELFYDNGKPGIRLVNNET